MNKYKYLTIILVLSIILGLNFYFSSNNSAMADELGEIKAVSTKGVKIDENKSCFTPIENKFGYSFKEYKNPRAKMNIYLPVNWNVDWMNDRMINIYTPSDDKYFPSTSFVIRYDFGVDNVQSASDMIKTFKNELFNTYYTIGNASYKLFDYKQPDIKTDTRYTNGHDNLVACAETKKVRVRSSESSASRNDFTKLDYYVNWEETPCVISCIVNNKQAQDARELLTLIASSIKYCNQGVTVTGKTAAFDNEFKLQLTLPHQFKPTKLEDNYYIYESSINNQSVFSGMTVIMGNYENEQGLNISEETITERYGREWFSASFDSTKYLRPTFYSEEMDTVKIKGKPAARIISDYSIIATDKEYPKYFILGETWEMETFILYGDKNTEVININYQESQKEQAEVIKNLILD